MFVFLLGETNCWLKSQGSVRVSLPVGVFVMAGGVFCAPATMHSTGNSLGEQFDNLKLLCGMVMIVLC